MWKNILQKGRKTSKYAIELIEKVMDSEPKTLTEVIDKIYDEIEKNERRYQNRGRIELQVIPQYQQDMN